ncbi:uncharacterized protein DFL_003092 [Arthrobotrys flagrans]|uniref:Uncharacterized protein n=1 Tax=Arthrobotrys flagrans TaxID=97331 RepID=A0A437ACW9_ARTFL|nr:hypothetical protein DFL_003092 [Arthrobotrys flagrans]
MGKGKKRPQISSPQSSCPCAETTSPQDPPSLGARKPPDSPIDRKVKKKRKRRSSGVSSDVVSYPAPDVCPPQVSPKLWRRFYEPLVLLVAYGKSQGPHFKSIDREYRWSDDNEDIRRRFLDQLAYVCDYERGGDTVTAIAIEDGPQLKYWIAGNTNKGPKFEPHISKILNNLEKVFGASDEDISALRSQISDRVIDFCSARLKSYRSQLHSMAQACLKELRMEDTEDAQALKIWLTSLCDQDLDLKALSRLCYDARSSKELVSVTRRAEETKRRQNCPSGGKYGQIRHLIGRLGSHIKAAGVLVEAGRHHPQLFLEYSVEVAACHSKFEPPDYCNKSSINGIINRMVNDPSRCKYYQNEIHARDLKFNQKLQSNIEKTYKDPTFKLKVHAEIILHDLFYRNNLQYLKGLRYIGVSKPSCFLCYRYLQAHTGMAVQTSGCSNNLYLGWQPPYIQDASPSSLKDQEGILNKMNQEIRKFVLDKIVPGYRGLKPHPDSTTGIETPLSVRKATPISHSQSVPVQAVPSESFQNIDFLPPKPLGFDSIDAADELSGHFGGGVPLESSDQYFYNSDDGGVSLFA